MRAGGSSLRKLRGRRDETPSRRTNGIPVAAMPSTFTAPMRVDLVRSVCKGRPMPGPQLTTTGVCWGSAAGFFFFFVREISRETAKLSSLFLDSRSDAVDSSADAADSSIRKLSVSLGT